MPDKHLVEILVTDECLNDLRLLYDDIMRDRIPLDVTIGPDDLDRYQDSIKAALISVISGCKEYKLPN